MNENQKLAQFILENVGGKENVESATHCMTRLRLKLKDNTKANRTNLDNHPGIISTQVAEGKLQVIIGTQVGDVYEEFIKLVHVTEEVPQEEIKDNNFRNQCRKALRH